MGVKVIGKTGLIADVDASGNLFTNNPSDSGLAGFTSLVSEKGVVSSSATPALDVSVDGKRLMYELETSQDYRLRVGSDASWFQDMPLGTVLNTSIWKAPVTSTMAFALAANSMVINSASSLTVNAAQIILTNKTFPIWKAFSTYFEAIVSIIAIPTANTVIEWGAFTPSGVTVIPADGAFFRITNGSFRGVISNASTESYIDLGTLPPPNVNINTVIEFAADRIIFWIDDIARGYIDLPPTQNAPVSVQELPLAFRLYNAALAPAYANQLKIGLTSVSLSDNDSNRLWPTALVGMGKGAYQSPSQQGAVTVTQLSNNANSAAPVVGVLSNTASVYGPTILGGQFGLSAIAGAETDYVLFAYLVPVGNSLIVRGIRIDTFNFGTSASTTVPTLFQWTMGIGGTAITLGGATTDTTAGVKFTRRISLGCQMMPASALVGQICTPIDVNLDAPVTAYGGEYLHIILKMPVGAATASQVFRGTCMINGYFE